MSGVKIVSGYVSLHDHPRTEKEYKELGSKLLELDADIACAYQTLNTCWLYKYLMWLGRENIKHSVSDNPKKNSVAYHIVQHQKTEWLVDAAYLDDKPDTFVWIDYGIFHVPGITGPIIQDFIKRVEGEKAIVIPGCTPPPDQISYDHPCWRYCGGLIVCPRQYLMEFDNQMKRTTMEYIRETGNISWEVNMLARLEKTTKLPLWWYYADHNQQMFENYRKSYAC